MGLLDHRKSWTFTLTASREDCIRAFSDVFASASKQHFNPLGSRWDVHTSGRGATAIYRGRAAAMQAVSMLSRTASAEMGSAEGSEVKFEVLGPTMSGQCECRMWLASRSSRMLDSTDDARFIRPAMQKVESALRGLDPRLQVSLN